MADLIVTLTCPSCRHVATETMPPDRCVRFYDCRACHAVLQPKPGDCCVYTNAAEGGVAQDPDSRPPAHLRLALAPARRVRGVREGAARALVDPDHRRHVRPPDSGCESCGRGPP